MKRGLFIALGILVASATAYGLYFSWASAKTRHLASEHSNAAGLAWVKAEFGLGDDQFAKLQAASADYTPRCEAMCINLANARKELARLARDPASTANAIESAHVNVTEIEAECFRMTLEHIFEVSALMEPENGARYRSQMITRLLGYRSNHHGMHTDIVDQSKTDHAAP